MVLQCGDSACGAIFCGWMCGWTSDSSAPAHSNQLAHNHVLECHAGEVGHEESALFPPEGTFDRVQKRAKVKLLTDKLVSMDLPVREAVIKKLREGDIVEGAILAQLPLRRLLPAPAVLVHVPRVARGSTPFSLTRGTTRVRSADQCTCTCPVEVKLGPLVVDVDTGAEAQDVQCLLPCSRDFVRSLAHADTPTGVIASLPVELRCFEGCDSYLTIHRPDNDHIPEGQVRYRQRAGQRGGPVFRPHRSGDRWFSGDGVPRRDGRSA